MYHVLHQGNCRHEYAKLSRLTRPLSTVRSQEYTQALQRVSNHMHPGWLAFTAAHRFLAGLAQAVVQHMLASAGSTKVQCINIQ